LPDLDATDARHALLSSPGSLSLAWPSIHVI
jgi:hypothetical protein